MNLPVFECKHEDLRIFHKFGEGLFWGDLVHVDLPSRIILKVEQRISDQCIVLQLLAF